MQHTTPWASAPSSTPHVVLGKALLGMETAIMDGANLAHVVAGMLDQPLLSPLGGYGLEAVPQLGGKHVIVLDPEDADAIHFLLQEVLAKTRSLKTAYEDACARSKLVGAETGEVTS